MKQLLLILFVACLQLTAAAQQGKTENLIIVTLDGMRWQEVYGGVDSALMNNKQFTRDSAGMAEKFWHADVHERRKKLFPFLWTTIAQQGQLYGNRQHGNQVDNANPYWFSYPGYNEIFTGYPDTAVNSNDKIPNPNETVLEFLNKQPAYKGKIAAFTTWDCFPYILNTKRSGIYVNADVDTLKFSHTSLQLINDIQFLTTRPIGVRPDVLTYMAAREYLKTYRPKVLYIAFDETDDFAHAGMYDQYLKSAYSQDRMIADLWQTLQAMPQYKNKTTLIITVDHGRGDKIKSNWQHHGSKIAEAHEIWLAAMGPDTPVMGEVKTPMQLYQQQIAATLALLLGQTFKTNHPVAEPISTLKR